MYKRVVEEESLILTMPEQTQNEAHIKVRRAEMDSICIYDVTEDELEILEKGSPSSLYLNFSLFLLSAAISFLASLIFTEIPSTKVFTVFAIITVVGFVLGLILLIFWYRDFRSSTSVAKRIKDRLKAETSPTKDDGDSVQPSA